jgi:hypothetical protein
MYKSSAFSSKSKKFDDAVMSPMESSGSSDWFDDPVERWRVLKCPLGAPLGTGLSVLGTPGLDRDFDMTTAPTVALLLLGNSNLCSAGGPPSSMSVREEADLGVVGVWEGGVEKL